MRKILISLLLALCLSATVYASPDRFVSDEAGLLTPEQLAHLERLAQESSQELECGIYIRIVEDFTDLGSYDIEYAAQDLYEQSDMGLGSDRDGILLLLSMEERDYTIYSGGSFGQKAMNDYAAAELSLSFLDDFKNDSWYDGLKDFIQEGARILSDGRSGKTHTVNSDGGYVTAGVIGLLVISAIAGGVTVLVLVGQLKSVRKKTQANDCVPQGGVQVTHRSDIYTHTTRSRRKIERNDSSGGGHSHVGTSGGGSRTGKF